MHLKVEISHSCKGILMSLIRGTRERPVQPSLKNAFFGDALLNLGQHDGADQDK
jgi:hypothetical protein